MPAEADLIEDAVNGIQKDGFYAPALTQDQELALSEAIAQANADSATQLAVVSPGVASPDCRKFGESILSEIDQTDLLVQLPGFYCVVSENKYQAALDAVGGEMNGAHETLDGAVLHYASFQDATESPAGFVFTSMACVVATVAICAWVKFKGLTGENFQDGQETQKTTQG